MEIVDRMRTEIFLLLFSVYFFSCIMYDLLYTVPFYSSLLEGMNLQLPFVTKVVVWLSSNLDKYWLITFPLIAWVFSTLVHRYLSSLKRVLEGQKSNDLHASALLGIIFAILLMHTLEFVARLSFVSCLVVLTSGIS